MTHHPPEPLVRPELAGRRESYAGDGLLEPDLAATPLEQFLRWFEQAASAGPAVPEPNAMVLATVGQDGAPAARTVLLKGVDARGFVFFTNHGSRKARHIAGRPGVSLCFPWFGMRRQVVVQGVAEQVPAEESAAYFRSRPWASRIGAWASHQSEPVAGRAELDDAWARLAARWPDHGRPDDVPVPAFWGGYLVRAVEVEFWQGRTGRLHDRLVFVRSGGGMADAAGPAALDAAAAWRVERRQP